MICIPYNYVLVNWRCDRGFWLHIAWSSNSTAVFIFHYVCFLKIQQNSSKFNDSLSWNVHNHEHLKSRKHMNTYSKKVINKEQSSILLGLYARLLRFTCRFFSRQLSNYWSVALPSCRSVERIFVRGGGRLSSRLKGPYNNYSNFHI